MATTVNNEATVTYSIGSMGQIQVTTSNPAPITLETNTNITVAKSASPTTFSAGDIITYSVVISNTGPNYLNGIRIIDNLGGGNLAYVVGSAKLTTSSQTYAVSPIATNPLTFSLQQMNVNTTMTLTYKCQVIFNLPASVNSITNSVEAIGYTSSTSFSAFANSTIQKKTVDEFNVTKSTSVTKVYPNQVFSYIITLTNNHNEAAIVYGIADSLPANFVLQTVSLKIGSAATTTLATTDYTLSADNNFNVPSSTGPAITVPAGGTTVLTISGYFS